MTITIDEREIPLPGTPFTTKVYVAGEGPPVVYLHGASGHVWTPLHTLLAEHFTVHAVLHPGWDDQADLAQMDSLWDLVLYYYELFEALAIESPAVVGHSFGAMVAAELAATDPRAVSKLALIAPLGLWRDDDPVADLWGLAPAALAARLWADPSGPVAAANSPSTEPEAQLASYLANTAAAHFVWPIPDRDLRRRLHRIKAKTLLIWGSQDGIVSPAYADDFSALLTSSETLIIERAAHQVHLEQPEAVGEAVIAWFS